MAYGAGPPGADDLLIAAGQANTAYVAHLLSLLSEDFTYKGATCYDLAHPDTPAGTAVATNVGTRSGSSALPVNSTAALIFPIARRYRGARPKAFAPFGVANDTNTTNAWEAGFVTAAQNAWTAFVTALSGEVFGSATWGSQVGVSYIGEPYRVVVSPTTGRGRNVGTPRNPPVVYPVTGVVLSPTIGTQRRRLR